MLFFFFFKPLNSSNPRTTSVYVKGDERIYSKPPIRAAAAATNFGSIVFLGGTAEREMPITRQPPKGGTTIIVNGANLPLASVGGATSDDSGGHNAGNKNMYVTSRETKNR